MAEVGGSIPPGSTMSEIFTSFHVMKEHHDIVPPLLGQEAYIASGDDDEGWYIYDGQDWVRQE